LRVTLDIEYRAGQSRRDSLDHVGSLRRAEVGSVQLVHYDGGTIPSDHYPVLAEIHY
jgi:endonuclease/exonuclease/phosphatase family metal-dependent hydrolase